MILCVYHLLMIVFHQLKVLSILILILYLQFSHYRLLYLFPPEDLPEPASLLYGCKILLLNPNAIRVLILLLISLHIPIYLSPINMYFKHIQLYMSLCLSNRLLLILLGLRQCSWRLMH